MIELVKASVADAPLLAKTRKIVWQETYRGIYPDAMLDDYDLEAYTHKDAQRIAEQGNHYYLFLDGDDCVGYFSFGPYHYGTYKDFEICLNHLYIRNGFKEQGLGKQAFAVMRDFCVQEGIDHFFCGCNVNNLPAVSFYRHMGGIQGDEPLQDVPRHDQIIHFEFYLKD